MNMRVEATIPELRGKAMAKLAKDLGLSRSQIVDEALGLLLTVIVEKRKGRWLEIRDQSSGAAVGELVTPTLAALDWAGNPADLRLPAASLDAIRGLHRKPPAPNARLRAAAKRWKS